MFLRVDRIMGSGPLQRALISFVAVLACPAWTFAQGTATGASGNASAVVLGSCNVVQQNVAAAGEATIINEINCIPENPEDSFLLRYLWLDATTSSFMVAGRFDPALARLLPGNPVVVRNPIFEKVQEIVTRFGHAIYTTGGYTIMGNRRGDIIKESPRETPPKKLRIYAGEEKIILPDMPSLRAVFKTQQWPSTYMMIYRDHDLWGKTFPDVWKIPPADFGFQNAVISCVLLHAPISADLLMNYWNLMAELENKVLKKEFRPQQVINGAFGLADFSYKSIKLGNKAIDATLYFGQKNWPDDFLLAFGNADGGGNATEGCFDTYNFGFYARPRRLFTLVGVIEPRYKDLQIEHIGYVADLDEQLRLLRVPTQAEDSPPGVITVKKGEMAVVPLRIELRYDLDEEEGDFYDLQNVSSADILYKRIKNTALSSIQFRGRDDRSSAGTQEPLRTIFSKSITSFRPPETRKINRTYIFGIAYNLKTIRIKEKDIPVRSAPAAAVAFLGGIQGEGSCPFLYVSADRIDDPIRVGRVLIGASKQELARVDETKLPREAHTFFLSEQEPEVTYLETVVVKNASSGEERLVASNLVIHPGQAREFQVPEEFYGDAILKIRGYYVPLRLDQSADEDGAPSSPPPN